MTTPVDVYLAYAPEDDTPRKELERHLSALKREKIIRGWSARQVSPGAEFRSAIDAQLDAAQIILLLLSADFLASDHCFDVEVRRALDRKKAGRVGVILILLRACDMSLPSLADLPALPSNRTPVMSWDNRDEAWTAVAQGIRESIQELDGAVPERSALVSGSSKESWARAPAIRWAMGLAVLFAIGVVSTGIYRRLARDPSALPKPPPDTVALLWVPTDCPEHPEVGVAVERCGDTRTLVWLQGQFNRLRDAHARGFVDLPVNPRFETRAAGGQEHRMLVTSDESGKLIYVGVGYANEGQKKDGCLHLYQVTRQRRGSACVDRSGQWWVEEEGEYRRAE